MRHSLSYREKDTVRLPISWCGVAMNWRLVTDIVMCLAVAVGLCVAWALFAVAILQLLGAVL